jgi:hypothetical protein
VQVTQAERGRGRDPVSELFERQFGLATLAQLLAVGLTRAEIRARLERHWQYVLPRVVAVTRAPLDERQRMLAALLMCGPEAVVASMTAAAWHGVRAAAVDRRVRIAIPSSRRVVSRGFVLVLRTDRPDTRAWRRDPLVVSAPARAVADAAREAGRVTARAIVIEAVQRRLVTTVALEHEVDAGPRRGSRALRDALHDAELGAWSIPEADLAKIVATSKVLPAMWANPELRASDGLRLPTPDGWFDDVGLAVQVHSKRFHAGELEWEATVSADGVFAEYGIPLVAVTPRQIAAQSGDVLGRIERAYEQARRRPRPDVLALPTASAA